jgi:hypothetical protein
MPGRYRNEGARFTAENGQRIDPGQEFDPSPRDLAMRRAKLRLVAPLPMPERTVTMRPEPEDDDGEG